MSKQVSISVIRQEDSIYPRDEVIWRNIEAIKDAMIQGVKMPPIILANVKGLGKNILIDGWHRLGAAEKLNQQTILATTLSKTFTEKEAFAEAVKRNVSHGQPMSFFEKIKAAKRLKDDGFPLSQIADIVRIEQGRLTKTLKKRLRKAITGEEVILKRPLINLPAPQSKAAMKDQDRLQGVSQVSLIKNLIILIENKWLDLSSKTVREEINILKILLKKI